MKKKNEPPPARKRRSEGLPPSDGKAPRPPCVEGLLSIVIEPLRRTDRTCASGRVAPCIAVMSATWCSRVLPQTFALKSDGVGDCGNPLNPQHHLSTRNSIQQIIRLYTNNTYNPKT